MEKFYFTYGTAQEFPYQRGWTLVYAPNMKAATEIFRTYHPDVTEGFLNCADYYRAKDFEKSESFIDGNMGGYCHEAIGPFTVGKEASMKSFVYGMRLRGFSIGCQPREGFIERRDSPTDRFYDLIVYSRPLTEQEVKDYDLTFIGVDC